MKSGLIVVDLQNEYLPTGKLPLSGIEVAVANAARVIAHARTRKIPVFHIRHESVDGDAPMIVKNHINSFRGTDLKQQLDAHGIDEVIVIGAMSHMCIDAVVRAAADMGYPVTVLQDACATLDLTFAGVTVPAAHVHAAMMAAFEFGYANVKRVDDYL